MIILKVCGLIIFSVLNVNCSNTENLLESVNNYSDISPQRTLYKTEITIIDISPVPYINTLVEPRLTISEDSLISRIKYPEIARRACVQGIILIEFIVNEFGDISQFTITKGQGAGCDEALANAFKDLKFIPAYYDDTPIEIKMNGSFHFRLFH